MRCLRHSPSQPKRIANGMADEEGATNPARLAVLFAQSGLAASVAETATLPLDTAKVRRTAQDGRMVELVAQDHHHAQRTCGRRIE